VPSCVLTIVAVSLPALLLLFVVVRTGASTQPVLAGTVTGLLAGALGALAYTIGCRNDGGLFVMIWYPLAIAIVAGIGAASGRRALAW
jgi:hypothetical protein